MGDPHQPIMQTGWVGDPAEAVTHIYRMQDKRDPFRYMDFDPRAWNFIVVPINPDEGFVGYTNADQPSLVADRREQADAIMPLIGPLIDAWDGLPSDVREAFDLESPDLTSALAAIAEAMFDPTASKSPARDE